MVIKPHRDIIRYIRTYMDRLFSNKVLSISILEDQHKKDGFLIHPKAATDMIDVEALMYCFRRLPTHIFDIDNILLTPSMGMVIDAISFSELRRSFTQARRRACYATGNTLIMTLQSYSDVHDIVPILTTFQIEHNKIHERLRGKYFETEDDIADLLDLKVSQIEQLREILGGITMKRFRQMSNTKKHFRVKLKSKSTNHYEFHAGNWATNIKQRIEDMGFNRRDVYLVSSNTHAIANLLGGYALHIAGRLQRLEKQYIHIRERHNLHEIDFRYFLLSRYLRDNPDEIATKLHFESMQGITLNRDMSTEHLNSQIIDMSRINHDCIDSRLKLKRRNCVIINIDYPFGEEAHYVAKHLIMHLKHQLKGIFIMGKAGALCGKIADLHVPSSVYDEVSAWRISLTNCLRKKQPASTVAAVHGTVLHNRPSLENYRRQRITSIEMESGPFLRAIYDHYAKKRVQRQDIDMRRLPVKIGLIYYTSDLPLEGRTLAGPLSANGIASTYKAALTILRNI